MPAQQAAASIDPEKIRAHVRFLADDLLEGRGPGTRGGDSPPSTSPPSSRSMASSPRAITARYFQKVPLLRRAYRGRPDHASLRRHQRHAHSSSTTATIALPRTKPAAIRRHRRPHRLRRLRHSRARVPLGRLRRPRREGQDPAGHRQRAALRQTRNSSRARPSPTTAAGPTSTKRPRAAAPWACSSSTAPTSPAMAGKWCAIRRRSRRSYLQNDPLSTLKAASWIQHDVAGKLLTAAGYDDVDQAIEAAGKRGFQRASSWPCASRPTSPARSASTTRQRDRRAARRAIDPGPRPGRHLLRALRSPGHRSRLPGDKHL